MLTGTHTPAHTHTPHRAQTPASDENEGVEFCEDLLEQMTCKQVPDARKH